MGVVQERLALVRVSDMSAERSVGVIVMNDMESISLVNGPVDIPDLGVIGLAVQGVLNALVQSLVFLSHDRGGRIKIHRYIVALLIFPVDDVDWIIVKNYLLLDCYIVCIIARVSTDFLGHVLQ